MKTIQINTTQNVPINFEVADIGVRLLAFFIDNILKFAYLFLIYKVLEFDTLSSAFSGDSWSKRAFFIIINLPITLYSLVSELLMNGQTIGKRVMKIKIINIDGFKPSKADYIMRWFLRLVDFNFWILIFVYAYSLGVLNSNDYEIIILLLFFFGKLIGFLSIIISKKNQRVGDMAANTIVISLKDQAKFSQTILEEISDVYKPTYPNVINLSDNDLRIIKDNYVIAKKGNDHQTLIKLRKKIIDVTGIEKKHSTDKEFIDVVLKDYNYYTQDM